MANQFREAAERSAKGPARRLNKGESTEVRFLFELGDEVHGWRYLASYYDPEKKRSFFFEDDEDIPAGKDLRETFLAVAYDVEKGAVEVWELRKTMIQKLLKCEAEYKTVTDRNYRLKRTGDGLDTEYDPIPLDSKPLTKKMEKAKNKAEDILQEAVERLLSYAE